MGEIRRQTFLQTTLPNSRRAELKAGTLSVWTRSGEELSFTLADVNVMAQMFKVEAEELRSTESKDK
jgi:hypothetical protein